MRPDGERIMDSKGLVRLREWFDSYSRSFFTSDEEDNRNLLMKVVHTHFVCRDMALLCQKEGIKQQDAIVAEAIALLHDVGRFPQYAKYKTYNDGGSENHGLLGAKVLGSEGVLSGIPEEELITDSVKYHNAFRVPGLKDERKLFFIKLVRDADKLDIWRVALGYYVTPKEERASAVGLGLPDEPGCTEGLTDFIREGTILPLSKVRVLNDFKLLQLSWVYDLNFKSSFEIMLERDYIGRLAALLPDDEDISESVSIVRDFVQRHA
jgi:hypothetical protein